MRKIFLFIAFISMYFLGQAQYAPTSSKTRFVNGIGLSTKDTASLSNAGDTLAMIVGKDSLVYFKYKGYWKPIAYNSSLNSYVKYSDTSSMLSPYQRSFSAMKYSDTATMLSSYYNKTATNSLLNTKLNTSDTATMLSGYKTYYPRNAISGGTGISYNPSTGVITNTSSGTVTSVATNNGSGITGGTITTSGTIAADTSVLATRLRVQKGIDSLGAAKISGSGSGNYVAKFTGVGVTIGNSTMQDDGSKVSMSGQLEVGGYVKAGTSIQSEAYQNLTGYTGLSLSSGVGVPRVLIGIPTDDNTNKLQVQGGTRITGQLTLGSTITNGTYTYTLPSATGTIALVGGSGVGTVTSVATDATMTGGTITTTGTLKVDTTVMATRLRVQKGIDSVNANVNLKVNISDTATMLSSYYNKTATDSKLALKLNISDTATMLSPYARTLALGGYIPYTGATGAIDLNAKTVVNISKLGINTTTVPTILLRVIGDNNSTSRIAMRGYSSDANSSSIRVTKFRGTVASPQAPLSGDGLGKFELAGYGTTSSDGYPQASFEGIATENWGATARGAKVQVKVTPNTTITQAIALTINQDKSAVFENSITGTSLIKTGGTSSQFLKADGSVDANAYLNISDTATMLSGYKTYYPRAALSAGTGITYNASTGVITNSSPSTGGTVTSVATNTGSGITGGTITSSGTIAADTSVLSTKANVTASLLSKVSSVSGTSPIASSGGLTPAISISQSSGSTNGYLSSTDWNTFNNKGSGSVTSVATDATMTGGTITTSGTLKVDTSIMATRLRVQKGIDSLGAAKQGNITLTTTGTSGAATFSSNTLNIPNYGSALSGYVTLGTDQTITAIKTFNNTTTGNGGLTLQRTDFATNENILKFTTGSTVNWKIGTGSNGDNFLFNNGTTNVANLTTSGVLTTNGFIKDGGTSSQYLMADGSVSTLTNPVTGTGTTNYLPKFTGSSTIGNSAITDDGTTVTLVSRALSGTSATFSGLTINSAAATNSQLNLSVNSTTYGYFGIAGSTDAGITGTVLGSMFLRTESKDLLISTNGGTIAALKITSGSGAATFSNRVMVNAPTDDGSTTLQVNGTGRFSSSVTAAQSKFWDGTQGLYIGAFTGGAGFGALYPSTVTPSVSNHAFAASSGATVINVGTGGVIDFEIGTSSKLLIASTGAATLSNLAGMDHSMAAVSMPACSPACPVCGCRSTRACGAGMSGGRPLSGVIGSVLTGIASPCTSGAISSLMPGLGVASFQPALLRISSPAGAICGWPAATPPACSAAYTDATLLSVTLDRISSTSALALAAWLDSRDTFFSSSAIISCCCACWSCCCACASSLLVSDSTSSSVLTTSASSCASARCLSRLARLMNGASIGLATMALN